MATSQCSASAWRASSRPMPQRVPFSSHAGLQRVCVRPLASLRDATTSLQPTQECSTSSTNSPVELQGSWTASPMWLRAVSLLAMATASSPAHAEAAAALESVNPFSTVAANSLYVTGALILMCVPGIWSQIKRAPKANKKRKVYEVDGPAREGHMPLRDRARQIVSYFKKYNYEVKEMGEVITFAGLYRADRGQAAAVTFYTFAGMASVALVLSVLVPEVGGWWYLLTLAAPAAWWYYFQNGERVEEVKVKMATSDDESVTDIIIEGDIEEIERFRKELDLVEKGMIRVKGLLEV